MAKPSKLIFSILATISTFATAANNSLDPEWRLLGPAAAFHNGFEGSYITKPATGVMVCHDERGYTCTGVDIAQQRGWQEKNPAIGIEFSQLSSPGASSRDRFFATIVKDSYNQMSLMAGVGRGWAIGSFGTVRFEMGASGGLWYRTVAGQDMVAGKKNYCFTNDPKYGNVCLPSGNDYYMTEIKRAFVPFILPFLSVTESVTGVGFNLAIAPKIKIGSMYTVPTTTFMLQTTYKF
ncbi:MAG: hypothetical protein COY49_00620 [Comamonadaceae bacterium CG_4_10_14_0_8_um_filter_57_29]|nr:MAG: hypothetical protein COY49_00620 [Comamonadaceae bacterium CG_4_10_14_0_8_um_filter_57_29]